MQQHLTPANSAKLTSWAKEPTVQDLGADLEASKTAHDIQVGKIDNWNDLLNVKGAHKPKKQKGRSSVQPKLVRRQAEWRYAPLSEPFLSGEKIFKVDPTTFEDDKGAKQNELLLNYQFRTKLNRVKFIDDYVRSTVDDGTSIVQVGWHRRTAKLKKKVPVYTHYEIQDEEAAQLFQQALELRQSDPRTYAETVPPEVQAAIDYYDESGEPSIAVATGEEEVDYEKVLDNRPTLRVLNPKNVYIDPSCDGDLDKAMFVIVSFETCQADLKKEGKRYKNLSQVNWEGASVLSEPDHVSATNDTTFQFKDAPRKRVVAYEYWGFYDIHGNGELTPFVATWIGNIMIRMELNPFPDEKLPFVVVPYLPVKRELYGEPDAELLEDNQKIQGAVMRGMIDLLGRSANGQVGFAKGALDPLNRRRYENGQDYEYNPNQANSMIEHKYPELPQSGLTMLGLQNAEAEALTGVKSFSGGMSGDSFGDVAAGVRGVLDAASKREMSILRRLAKGMSEIGTKIIAMNAVFLSKEEVVRVTNTEFVTIQREDLKGNYDLKIDISTAEIDDAQAKDLAFMLQTIGNSMDPSFVVLILAEIARLKKMVALEKKLLDWKPEPDPVAEQMKQLQLEEQQLKNEELRSSIELNRAKARQAEASAAQTVLDAEEQGSGTKHARDIERQRAQASGNKDLVVTKALATARKEGEKAPDIEAAIGYNALTDNSDDVQPIIPPTNVDFVGGTGEQLSVEPEFNQTEGFQDPAFNPEMIPA
jgi:hypothetical protein